MDPLTEKYPNIGGYVYCYDNPIRYIDLDGRRYFDWDTFFNGIKDGYIAPAKNLVKAISSPVETLKALDSYAATTSPVQMQDDMLNQMTGGVYGLINDPAGTLINDINMMAYDHQNGTSTYEQAKGEQLGGLLFDATATAVPLGAGKVSSMVGKGASAAGKGSSITSTANVYDGVKLASKYLQSQGVSRADRISTLRSFQIETISLKTADNGTFGLRFFGGKAYPKGRYLFPTFSNSTNRVGLALPPQWNSMTGISQFQVAPGSKYIFGRAASQGGIYTGGNYQMYINNTSNLIK